MLNFVNTRTRVTFGLVCLLVSVLMAALFLGLIPDRENAVLDGRRALCESVAVSTSILVTHSDLNSIRVLLDDVARRNKDLLSAGLRRADGRLMLAAGDHVVRWKPLD